MKSFKMLETEHSVVTVFFKTKSINLKQKPASRVKKSTTTATRKKVEFRSIYIFVVLIQWTIEIV